MIKQKKEWLYLLHEIGSCLYKIGITNNIIKRYKNIQQENAHELVIVREWQLNDANKIEGIIKKEFKENQARGEWLELDEIDLCALIVFIKLTIHEEYKREKNIEKNLKKYHSMIGYLKHK